MADPPFLKLSGVTRRFASVTAVDRVSFEVAQGERVALLGPNGAGKSTVLEMILGLLRPSQGEISLLASTPAEATASGRVGVMLQRAGLPRGARIAELVKMVRRRCRHPLSEETVLRLSDLEQVADRRVERLSGGQQQRVRFALALAGAPDLLVLDEPTESMDVAGRRSLWSGAAEYLSNRRALLFTTHRLDEAEQVADRVLLLSAGRLVADGSPQDLRHGDGGHPTVSFRAGGIPLEALQRLPAVECVAIADGRVSLSSNDVERTVRAVLDVGPEIEDLEVAAPRFEEAFLNLTGEATPQ